MNAVSDGDLERSLRRAFRDHEHLADPHAAAHVVREVRARGSRRSYRTPLVALVVAGLLAAAGVLDLHQRGRVDVAHGGQANVAATRHRVTELIALSPVLPGAHALTRSPVADLDKPPSVPVSDNVVSQSRWWTAPGTVEAAVAWLTAHPPGGLSYVGAGSSSGPGQLPKQDLTFSSRASHAAYAQDQLLLSVVPLGNGVAVRADAQAIWLPDRTAASAVPLPVDSVELRITRPGTRARAATVRGERGEELARAVNALPAVAPGRYSCPAVIVGRDSSDVLTFHTRQRVVVVTVDLTGCTSVTVSVHGPARQPALTGAREIDKKVQALLD